MSGHCPTMFLWRRHEKVEIEHVHSIHSLIEMDGEWMCGDGNSRSWAPYGHGPSGIRPREGTGSTQYLLYVCFFFIYIFLEMIL